MQQVQCQIHLKSIRIDETYACEKRPGKGGVNVQVLLLQQRAQRREHQKARPMHLLWQQDRLQSEDEHRENRGKVIFSLLFIINS